MNPALSSKLWQNWVKIIWKMHNKYNGRHWKLETFKEACKGLKSLLKVQRNLSLVRLKKEWKHCKQEHLEYKADLTQKQGRSYKTASCWQDEAGAPQVPAHPVVWRGASASSDFKTKPGIGKTERAFDNFHVKELCSQGSPSECHERMSFISALQSAPWIYWDFRVLGYNYCKCNGVLHSVLIIVCCVFFHPENFFSHTFTFFRPECCIEN